MAPGARRGYETRLGRFMRPRASRTSSPPAPRGARSGLVLGRRGRRSPRGSAAAPDAGPERGAEWARWWTGGAFNYAAAAVDPRAAADPDGARRSPGKARTATSPPHEPRAEGAGRPGGRDARAPWREPGDRVGIFLPLLPETVIAVLALGRMGAIYIPIFSGYAAPAVASRLDDCGAKLLITADGFLRRGPVVPLKQTADEAVAAGADRRARVGGRAARRPAAAGPWTSGETSGGTSRWPTRAFDR